MVNTFEHKNYWALILGGSSGLGLATAKKLAAHGMHICVVHRNSRAQLPEITAHFNDIKASGVQFKSFNLDATNPEKRKDVIAELGSILGEKGKIRTLIHSIAKGNLKPMTDARQPTLKEDDFTITINAMAISLYNWTSDVFNANLCAKDTRIISFTSEGNTKAWKHYAAVSAAKVALEAISRHIALEFAPYGIRANCIQAGVTDTASLRKIPNAQTIIKHSLQRNPFKQLTTAEAVANVAYLLCTDEASWINGSIIPVDGGEHIS
ncbi:SDR family oxidoreductase [Bizionia sediminis]|uniref:SDR family oxidoreductase n=1 Tax=Bizionia sediminis TaxID=1737064 RepID=A0ABW5KY17_9FLAO